jgi:ribosomal protein S6|uniref:Ribosomal protein S6 n=1 Tax=Globisporangium ultimum (strain ATCC 200006 / CBS 805.95 / DAOM BR144) TaxID=431595 RepID=K3X5I1_GLOUD
MPLYKQVLLTNLKSTPKDVAQVFQECAQIITGHGGVMRALENRGEKRLGYGIEDRRWGELQRHYEGKLIVSQFNTSPVILKEIEAKLKNSFPIIRFQTFKIRDPIDTLMNTRQSLEQIQELLKPASKKPDVAEAFEVGKKSSAAAQARDISPESLFDTEDEDEQAQFKQYIPEWKRDAMFTPSPPQHLKNRK